MKNTRSGYRRSDPTSQPTGVSPPPPPAAGGGRVAGAGTGAGPAAAGDRSMECDICHIQEKSHWHLRNHYKAVHRKPNGSMYNCRLCQFGALNQVHLKKHFDTQHPDLSCENCDFKTKRESQLKYHMRQECPKAVKIEKKDVTCRYFLHNNCKKTAAQCGYMHKMPNCRFGQSCRNRSRCRFTHDPPQQPAERPPLQSAEAQQPAEPSSNTPVVDSGVLDPRYYEQNFPPFLGRGRRQGARRRGQ